MNTQNQNGYMLLFRGNDWYKSLSPEETQKVTDQWMAWFRRLTDQGKAVAGNPLEREGKIVSGKNRVMSESGLIALAVKKFFFKSDRNHQTNETGEMQSEKRDIGTKDRHNRSES